ncbi:hypothetical protein VHEMI00263 [[Torrubiella] hemipterigena]|uniref:NACHT domain-containing protein n=1 Tax=[Torrubiella] hemipterigena TaxID=1531966 RepID=A0A0A1SIU7_9HYPO|nr:hypothetical protein VHEMI00263 [[Torrubiella] hemipterigena]
MAELPPQFTHDDYTVGWICALPATELAAAWAMLDVEHPVLHAADPQDANVYLLGSIRDHNVVVACLPAEKTGKVSAATVAKDMLRSFKAIRFGLVVGIGGGAPYYGVTDVDRGDGESESEESDLDDIEDIKDIRLGDVVIGLHSKSTEAVIQYDFGKSVQEKEFIQAGGRLNKPPDILLGAVARLQGECAVKGHKISELLSKMLSENPGMVEKFSYPGPGKDRLFKSNVVHVEGKKSCKSCCGPLNNNLVKRKDRQNNTPQLHYGTIGSADQVMKDALLRDQLAQKHNIMCFEMEAAGLMDSFPCLVIRGICDYADSHKNKIWQPYAAAVAAAYAKELLSNVSGLGVRNLSPIEQINQNLEDVQKTSHQTNAFICAMRVDIHTERIARWLSPADPSTNINNAREARYTGTGDWFIQSEAFKNWKLGCNQCLWLHGMPGCGKTVLSTTILDNLAAMNTYTILTFFFDFRKTSNQRLDDMLHSIVFQLYCSRLTCRKVLDSLFTSHGDGNEQPDTDKLSHCLKDMMQTVGKVIILLDALDEGSDRPKLLKWMKEFIPPLTHVQLLCTSRPEDDIRQSLPGWVKENNCISLNTDCINADICSYVHARLNESEEYERWVEEPRILEMIKVTISGKAGGMFRWASCQLDLLRDCVDAESLEEALQSLPPDLDATYAQILENIPRIRKKKTIRLLQFLFYSERPLTLGEAIDVVAVRIDSGYFDNRDRLRRRSDITAYCSSLVLLTENKNNEQLSTVQLAHFSVKEYLKGCMMSEFISPEPMITITQICLAYLGSIQLGEVSGIRIKYPLARYASEIWMECAWHAKDSIPTNDAASEFLQNDVKFTLWASLFDLERPWIWNPGKPETLPLYLVCLSGLKEVASRMISNGADIHMQGGQYGNALQAASSTGHFETAQLLLDRGANINMQGASFDNALQAASHNGHFEIVQLLLDREANINIQGGQYGNALQAASLNGHFETVQLLLEREADMNVQASNFSDTLEIAAYKGYRDLVQLLVDKEAHTHSSCGRYTNVFHAAVLRQDTRAIQLFLDSGIDVNSLDQFGSTTLLVAVRTGRTKVAELLLARKDVDINAIDALHRSVSWWASKTKNTRIINLLLEHGLPATELTEQDKKMILSTTEFESVFRRCDACVRSIPSEISFYSCSICSNGDFAICLDCFGGGLYCFDRSHNMTLRSV